MNASPLGASTAIGFWSKHSLIMDQLYGLECEEGNFLPDDAALELQLGATPFVDVVKGSRDKLEQVLETAQSDVDRVDAYLRVALTERIQQFARITGRGRPCWGCHVWATHRDGRRKLPRIQLGWSWETGDSGLEVRAWLWSKGGSVARARAASYLQRSRCVAEQLKSPVGWERGTLPLAIVPVVFGDDFHVDLDALAAAVLSAFKWLDSKRLEGLLVELQSG